MTRADTLRVAAEASVDPRTVLRFVEGKPIRALAEERIVAAMKKLKLSAAK